MKHIRQLVRVGISTSVAAIVATNISWAQTLTWLGGLPGASLTEGLGVSDDGSVVVGFSSSRAFKWTRQGGMQDLGGSGWATDVSADGSVIVGTINNRPVRWTQSGMQVLIDRTGIAWGVSGDGQLVAGWHYPTGSWPARAFRWRPDGVDVIDTLGGQESVGIEISRDGSTVVGISNISGGPGYAFRWKNGLLQNLGSLYGRETWAKDASADGSVVVGYSQNPQGRWRPFVWRESTNRMEELSILPGYDNVLAYSVSGDGSIIVGYGTAPDGQEAAIRWIQGRMENLNETYANLLRDGSRLIRALGISNDGRYIVGMGFNASTNRTEAFLLDTGGCELRSDLNGDGVVDDADLLQVLFDFGRSCP